jgi:hypothetical protein
MPAVAPIFTLCKRPPRLLEAAVARVFPGSSAVEQPAVNRLVAGSNPARGATLKSARRFLKNFSDLCQTSRPGLTLDVPVFTFSMAARAILLRVNRDLMRTAVGHIALVAEPIAEAGSRERLAKLGHQEGQMATGVASMIVRRIGCIGQPCPISLMLDPGYK